MQQFSLFAAPKEFEVAVIRRVPTSSRYDRDLIYIHFFDSIRAFAWHYCPTQNQVHGLPSLDAARAIATERAAFPLLELVRFVGDNEEQIVPLPDLYTQLEKQAGFKLITLHGFGLAMLYQDEQGQIPTTPEAAQIVPIYDSGLTTTYLKEAWGKAIADFWQSQKST